MRQPLPALRLRFVCRGGFPLGIQFTLYYGACAGNQSCERWEYYGKCGFFPCAWGLYRYLAVTLGGVAYSNPLTVMVSPVATTPAPSYAISCTNCPSQSQGGFVLAAGGSVTALIAITPQNGYTGTPQVEQLGNLPAGIAISFDNPGIESAATGNVVAATCPFGKAA